MENSFCTHHIEVRGVGVCPDFVVDDMAASIDAGIYGSDNTLRSVIRTVPWLKEKEWTDCEQLTKWEPCQTLLQPAAHRARPDRSGLSRFLSVTMTMVVISMFMVAMVC